MYFVGAALLDKGAWNVVDALMLSSYALHHADDDITKRASIESGASRGGGPEAECERVHIQSP
ncbi:MAG: hypothetical protein OXU77_06940 [Gammaproteobacteria bacterium]|nr:hypothetical protein [Gammaproteobacteria bacterium]MDE0443831.1 hypothetical protein [Gammaproteobacteria bacterium]